MTTTMRTLSGEVNRLQKAGYNSEIIRDELKKLNPDDWLIKEICRFEGMSDPADNSILYAIVTKDNKRKSLIVDSFGSENSEAFSKFIRQVAEAPDIIHS